MTTPCAEGGGETSMAAHSVVQINKMYHPEIGGVESVVQTIAEGLVRRVRMTVVVCNTRAQTERSTVAGVDVVRSGSFANVYSMPVSISFFREVARACATAEILHLHVPFPVGDLAALFCRRKARLVIWWHSELVRQRLFARLFRPVTRMVLRRADRIIVATPRHIECSPMLRTMRDKCVVIPYGINLDAFVPTPDVARRAEELRHTYGTPLILFVGRLSYYKGVDVLLRAMTRVDARLLVVGDGVMGTHLRALAETLRITKKVVFCRTVPSESLAPYYHACDVFVLPSVAASEAFGIVQIEAMACGKPVVNTNLPSGVPWVSVHGVSGLTVPPGDAVALATALNTLLGNADLRQRYGAGGLARVRQWGDARMMVNATLEVYASVIDETQHGSE